MFEAVLFDFDGVIADTATENLAAWHHALHPHGMDISHEEYCLLEGKKSIELGRLLLERSGKSAEAAADLVAVKEAFYFKNHHGLRLFSGVGQVMPILIGKGLKLGLVSGGSARRINNPITAPIFKFFDVIVTADNCVTGKPSPEPYLHAAQGLGLQPQQCIVIENAPLGITSAKTAGMYCIGLSSTLDKRHLGEADFVIETLESLPALIETLLAEEGTSL